MTAVQRELTELRREFEGKLEALEVKCGQRFVTLDAFVPIRSVVYGLVSLILMGVVTGLLALVLRSK